MNFCKSAHRAKNLSVSQAEIKLPFREPVIRNVHQNQKGTILTLRIILRISFCDLRSFLTLRQHGKPQKCTEKGKAKVTKLETNVRAGVALQALGFYIINN